MYTTFGLNRLAVVCVDKYEMLNEIFCFCKTLSEPYTIYLPVLYSECVWVKGHLNSYLTSTFFLGYVIMLTYNKNIRLYF